MLIVINLTIKKLILVNLTFNRKILMTEVEQTISRCYHNKLFLWTYCLTISPTLNSSQSSPVSSLKQALIKRWDSEREPFYNDIAHVIQNTEKILIVMARLRDVAMLIDLWCELANWHTLSSFCALSFLVIFSAMTFLELVSSLYLSSSISSIHIRTRTLGN